MYTIHYLKPDGERVQHETDTIIDTDRYLQFRDGNTTFKIPWHRVFAVTYLFPFEGDAQG